MSTPLFCLFIFHILLALPTGMSDLSTERFALLSLRAAVGGRTLLWNVTEQTPCKWAGVTCENEAVTALRLPGYSLAGQLPKGVFGNLTNLRTLSLRFNTLSGVVPSDLGFCRQLRNLYLQGNGFSGDLSVFLFSLVDLVRVNLAQNRFSGELVLGFNNLTRLRTLYVENNQFSGGIPAEFNVPNLSQFNVSGNRLNGSVPESLRSMPESSFLGNSLCGGPLQSCLENITPAASPGNVGADNNESKKKNGLSGGAIAGIVIGSLVGFFVVFLLLMFLCRRRSSKKTSDIAAIKQADMDIIEEKSFADDTNSGSMRSDYPIDAAAGAAMAAKGETGSFDGGAATSAKKLVFFGNTARVFDLEDLLRASAEVLGKGTFGTAYKAVLEAGIIVAVKRLKDVTITEKEFKEKIVNVGAMDHENLVGLRAYYYSREEKLLVYDYMSMGSLSALLHGNKGAGRTPLNWEIRSSIALGTARGIEYLHSQNSTISHGNIKTSNILLTKSYEARVSDFGLAHLVGLSSTPNRVSGYRAPEITDPKKVSQKADVYSFGIVILELLTGKAPTHALLNEEGVDLPRWVHSIVREEWTSEVFDRELLSDSEVEEEMVQLLQLGIDCAAQFPDKRPSMSEVTSRIEVLRRSSLQENRHPHSDFVDEEE